MLRVIVFTSDPYIWAIRPFSHLFNTFWSPSQPVIVGGYTPPKFHLPTNFTFHQISDDPYPADRWSDGVIELLGSIPDEHVIILLDDYWLSRPVDRTGVENLSAYMRTNPDVLRMDLTSDRQFNGHSEWVGYCGYMDLVETPPDSEYQLSLQAGIWNRELLLRILRPGLTPWQTELYLSPELTKRAAEGETYRVLGTCQCPVRYVNVFRGGDSKTLLNLDGLPAEQRQGLDEKGLLMSEHKTAESYTDGHDPMTYAEIEYLRELAGGIDTPNPTIVNIGAADGISTVAFLDARPDAFIFSVDVEPCREEFDHLRECGKETERVVRLLGRSEEVGLHFPYECDLLFIDGGHFNAANDIDVWLGLVVPGGIVVLHDYIAPPLPANNPGSVWQDVNDKMDMAWKIGEVDRLIAFRVPA